VDQGAIHRPVEVKVEGVERPVWVSHQRDRAFVRGSARRLLTADSCGGGAPLLPPVISAILARLSARDLAGALTLAERRLRASGCRLLAPPRAVSRDQDCTAVAAALVIPLPDVVEHTVVARVVDPSTWPSTSKEVSRARV
jgi:hypothetical protein